MSLFTYPPFTPLPHTGYSFTVNSEISEEDKPASVNSSEAIIELRIRQNYALILEPMKGRRVSLDDRYVSSPELTLRFKIPLGLLVDNGPASLHRRDYIFSAQLASLPISAGLGQYLKPHIQSHAVLLAQETGHRRDFKMIFHVVISKIDLADAEECEKIRRGWLSSSRGSENLDGPFGFQNLM
ncbi:uncharacterized protein LOC114713294 [Neltuma alba]|uniref:uncharacterized protein LOC114713294 n=1 Tax=Neltuma alba TaxID=207710 RepID=UPI0010A34601|nr:uncharacterized protein LOC114713294 [Prosopis alba]